MSRLTRREFVGRLGLGGILLGAGGIVVALGRFLNPSVELVEPTRAVGGKPSDLLPGRPIFLAENRTWLLNDSEGIYALAATCTHLGCTVRWEEGIFRCPCHGSEYDHNGLVRKGPASRPLVSVWVGQSADGRLVVDRSRPVPGTYRLIL